MAAMKATSSPHTSPTSGSSELKGARILLVEDSWHVGNAIKRLLRALGADVAGPTATVADAERLIAERKPDVAIVDINLRDGEQANPLLDRLQEESIPVIVITGYTEFSSTWKGGSHFCRSRQRGTVFSGLAPDRCSADGSMRWSLSRE